jgi:hypothetical protein
MKWSILLLLLLANVLKPNLNIWQFLQYCLNQNLPIKNWAFFSNLVRSRSWRLFSRKKKRKIIWNYTENKICPKLFLPKKIHRILLFSIFYCKFAKNKRLAQKYYLLWVLNSFLKNSGLHGSTGPFFARNIITSIGCQLLLFFGPRGWSGVQPGGLGLQKLITSNYYRNAFN